MYPDKYLNDLKSSQRRAKYFGNVSYTILFFLGMYLLGPLIHEIGHITWIEIQGCLYRFTPGFKLLIGFYGKVEPLCYLSSTNLAIFYGSGYFSTFLAGLTLREIGMKIKVDRSALEFLAGGMLVSILVSVTYKGDVANMLRSVNLASLELPFLALIVLGAFGTSYKFLDEAQKGRKDN